MACLHFEASFLRYVFGSAFLNKQKDLSKIGLF